MTTQYIPTVERTGHFSAYSTQAEAFAQWAKSLGIIEAVGAAHPVLVRFYLDNGYDARGWYVSTAKQIDFKYRRNSRCRWSYELMTFNKSREYTPEAK